MSGGGGGGIKYQTDRIPLTDSGVEGGMEEDDNDLPPILYSDGGGPIHFVDPPRLSGAESGGGSRVGDNGAGGRDGDDAENGVT